MGGDLNVKMALKNVLNIGSMFTFISSYLVFVVHGLRLKPT